MFQVKLSINSDKEHYFELLLLIVDLHVKWPFSRFFHISLFISFIIFILLKAYIQHLAYITTCSFFIEDAAEDTDDDDDDGDKIENMVILSNS